MKWFFLIRTVFLPFIFYSIISCNPPFQKEYKKAKKALHQEQFYLVKTHLLKSLDNIKDISTKYKIYIELAELSHFKIRNYKEAIYFYQQAIAHSENKQHTLLPIERQAFIYSNNLGEYERATVKYNQLLGIDSLSESQKVHYHIQLIHLYYNRDKLFQAELEANRALNYKMNNEQKFKIHLLLGNIFSTKKQNQKAIYEYEKAMRNYPKKSTKHKVYYNLSLGYEEVKEFGKAIIVLKSVLPQLNGRDKIYVKKKIKSLQERRLNSPGFRIKTEAKK